MTDTKTDTRPRSAFADLSRAGADTLAVMRGARSASALQWVVRLATRAPAVVRTRSLRTADIVWQRRGARFRTPGGRSVYLPGALTAGAREMYCRNVYLKTGLTIPAGGWVLDLGANAGLFTVLAAVEGANVIAVEAQRDFATEIATLAALNDVDPGRVRIEIALVAGAGSHVPQVGVVADDERWRTASHAAPERPARVSVPDLMDRYGIDRIGLIKMDIEGSEFSVLDRRGDLTWLSRVDQLAMEVHPPFGDLAQVRGSLLQHGFTVCVTDNDGRTVPARSPDATYVYCRRKGRGR